LTGQKKNAILRCAVILPFASKRKVSGFASRLWQEKPASDISNIHFQERRTTEWRPGFISNAKKDGAVVQELLGDETEKAKKKRKKKSTPQIGQICSEVREGRGIHVTTAGIHTGTYPMVRTSPLLLGRHCQQTKGILSSNQLKGCRVPRIAWMSCRVSGDRA
jgi:hypothetical protein